MYLVIFLLCVPAAAPVLNIVTLVVTSSHDILPHIGSLQVVKRVLAVVQVACAFHGVLSVGAWVVVTISHDILPHIGSLQVVRRVLAVVQVACAFHGVLSVGARMMTTRAAATPGATLGATLGATPGATPGATATAPPLAPPLCVPTCQLPSCLGPQVLSSVRVYFGPLGGIQRCLPGVVHLTILQHPLHHPHVAAG